MAVAFCCALPRDLLLPPTRANDDLDISMEVVDLWSAHSILQIHKDLRISAHHVICMTAPCLAKPNWPQATVASVWLNASPQIVPQALLKQISSLPSLRLLPFTSLSSPSAQSAMDVEKSNRYAVNVTLKQVLMLYLMVLNTDLDKLHQHNL